MSDRQINGAGVAIAAAGAVVAWSGIRNVPILDAFRDLAMGRPPTPRDKAPYKPVDFEAVGGQLADSGLDLAVSGAKAGRILAEIAKLKGTPYVFGGGHGTPCKGPLDCSGAVSCALIRAGAARSTMTTDGLARWGRPVPFEAREPGDVVVWQGGPGGGHTGIVIDKTRMWHTNCAGCGGVRVGTYGKTRTGRPTIVRRAP